ncbi:hypothetical protein AB0A76_00655 [Streptomyces exfoliatus]|uniref:Uncharacterized protein n=1 Tax=Streptomyces exfoliatus TaxID=1905 RepID=A0ABV3CND4_STREX
MNPVVYWVLLMPCVAAVVWGALIGNWDLFGVGVFAEVGVLGVHRLLVRADECEGGEAS